MEIGERPWVCGICDGWLDTAGGARAEVGGRVDDEEADLDELPPGAGGRLSDAVERRDHVYARKEKVSIADQTTEPGRLEGGRKAKLARSERAHKRDHRHSSREQRTWWAKRRGCSC